MNDAQSKITENQPEGQAENQDGSPETGSPALRAQEAYTRDILNLPLGKLLNRLEALAIGWCESKGGTEDEAKYSWKAASVRAEITRQHELVFNAVRLSVYALSAYIVPDSGITDRQVVERLLEILDDQKLAAFLKVSVAQPAASAEQSPSEVSQ